MYNERRPHTGDILSGGCTCIMKGDPILGISYQGVYMYNERRPHTGDILLGGVYMCNERRPHTGDILSGGVHV